MTCIFVFLGKGLESDDAAACMPGVKCFFCTLLSQVILHAPVLQCIQKEGPFENMGFNRKTN